MRPSEHLFDFGRPVAYYPGLVKHLGSVNAVLLFCQFFYWKDRTDNELGVYKSAEEIEHETGLSYREQATARKQLVERGVLIETHKRLEHRIYFRIDVDRLDALLSSADCETCNSRNALSAVRGETKAQFDHTETTTETTSENFVGKAFEVFWSASTKNGSKKKAAGIFASLCKRDKRNPMEFAAMLVDDTAKRLRAKQYGFDKLHITTYLNQERWSDTLPEQPRQQSRHHGLDQLDYGSGEEGNIIVGGL